jgi:hypothetical protein
VPNPDLEEIIERLFKLSAFAHGRHIDIRSELDRRGVGDVAEAIDQLRVDIVNELTADILTLRMYCLERERAVGR